RFSRDWSSDVCSSDLDLRNQGKFFAEIHEDTFDLIVMMAQQQQEQLDRAVKVPIGSDTPADDLLAEFKQDIADAQEAARESEARSEERRVGKECRSGW